MKVLKSLREEVIASVSPLIDARTLRKIYPPKRKEFENLNYVRDPALAIDQAWSSVGDDIRFAMKKYARSKK